MMFPRSKDRWIVALAALWLLATSAGLAGVWRYAEAAGAPAVAPAQWPAASHLAREATRPTLVLLMHPHCPCSRATVAELARLLARCPDRATCYVLFVRPAGIDQGWEQTDLWRAASAIPGVHAVSDDSGTEAAGFGSHTSGQALLYGRDGRLSFAGGITAGRGHEGDNDGCDAIARLLLSTSGSEGAPSRSTSTPVFGCPLHGSIEPGRCEGSSTCPRR